jgi:hypothetical protein
MKRRTGLISLPIAALALTTMLASCAASEPGLSAAPTTMPGSTDDAAGTELSNETSIPWTAADAVSPTELRVRFTARSPTCFATRTDVAETADAVMITVLEGTLPNAPTACTLVGQVTTASVKLTEPLGNRTIEHAPTDNGATDASPFH